LRFGRELALPLIFAVENGKVLNADGEVIYEGDVFIANMSGVKISGRTD